MNKELIQALEECQKAFDNLCGNSMMYKPLRVNIKKALQKAKEQPTKNAEEFLKSKDLLENTMIISKNPDLVYREYTLKDLLEEYSNQSNWISVEDKKQLLIDYSKWLQQNGYEPYSSDFAEAFLIENDIKPQPPVTNDKQ